MVSAQSCCAQGAIYSFGATTTFIVAFMKVFVFVFILVCSVTISYKKNIANGICDVLTTEAVTGDTYSK